MMSPDMMQRSACAPDLSAKNSPLCGRSAAGTCRKPRPAFSAIASARNGLQRPAKPEPNVGLALRLKNVTIIGGGIAGLSAGIALRQHGVPVTVIESKEYPRHKVCGEFVSGRGLEVLASVGIDVSRLGVPVQAISFHQNSENSFPLALPQPGVGISRYRFDFILAETLKKLGGHVRSSCRFQSRRLE